MQHGSRQLKDWQARQGFNQREAAAELGVHFTTYNQFLSARRMPGRTLAVAMQDRTGIPVCAWTPTKKDKTKKRPYSQTKTRQCLQGANA